MNMLTALIIEGNVTRGLSTYEDKGDFGIEVIRNYKNRNNEIVEEKSYFDVELYGNLNLMARNSPKDIYEGRGVRIVGRLKQVRWTDDSGKSFSKIVIIAEYIEFKPKYYDKKKEEK